MIEGVLVTDLKQIYDERGSILHMIRSDSDGFQNFGECYFSEIFPHQIKAWKKHKLQTQNITVPYGRVQVIIFDDREYSQTYKNLFKIEIGRPDSYIRLTIPPKVCYGFKSIINQVSLIVNCTNLPYSKEESLQIDILDNHIPYSWI
jgi:dTDP-4-dehydrorhamnose 3,5-epimerase